MEPFNLTPTIMISTREELEAALSDLADETDMEWLAILRERAEEHLPKE
jgi:hypothetical protein